MKKVNAITVVLILGLVAVTFGALAYANRTDKPAPPPAQVSSAQNGPVSLTGKLTQTKILQGGDGTFSLALTMTADELFDPNSNQTRDVDLVVVLDRSGSMEGQKISDAKKAILELIASLSHQDRLALVSYSDGVSRHFGLMEMTDGHRQQAESAVREIYADGGTNLGAGLKEGIDIILGSKSEDRVRRIILISDGLANQGIVDPAALGRMASVAVEKSFGVSTVGVGLDFNESLMTTLADRGAGNYYFMETPSSFARVFQKEFQKSRLVAANSVEVSAPIAEGLELIEAAGYPVEVKDGRTVFYPGDLLSGQSRKVYLTFRADASSAKVIDVKDITLKYRYKDDEFSVKLPQSFQVACVVEQKDVYASMDKDEWGTKVVQDDYGRLQEQVARDIAEGNKEDAMARVDEYYQQQMTANETVGSSEVEKNLTEDVSKLRETVTEAFSGEAEEVQQKQKSYSKTIQHEGYGNRRALK